MESGRKAWYLKNTSEQSWETSRRYREEANDHYERG